MNELWRYYDKRATFNVHHSKNLFDIFRLCVRKDRVLSKALNSDFTRFDLDVEQANAVAETNTVANAAASQPTVMDV